jgi:hypothetical protein
MPEQDVLNAIAAVQTTLDDLMVSGEILVGPGVGSIKYEDTILGTRSRPVIGARAKAYPYVDSLADFDDLRAFCKTDEHGTFSFWLDAGQYVLRVEKSGTVIVDSIITVVTPGP